MGPAVRDVSKEFDLYWNSASAYPAASFVGAPGPDAAANLKATFRRRAPTRNRSPISRPCARHRSFATCSTASSTLEWTTANVVHDDPAKTLDTTARTDVLLFPKLMQTIGRPEKTLDLVSPYFVPGANGYRRPRGAGQDAA